MSGLETVLHQHTVNYINALFKDINKNLIRRFDKHFKKDEQGKPREWKVIEEGQIREIFERCKKETMVIIESFKYIMLDKGALTNALSESSKWN